MGKSSKNSPREEISTVKKYVSVATLYVATDIAYDFGLLKLPFPMGDILYYGRYGAVLIWYAAKFCQRRFDRSKSKSLVLPDHPNGQADSDHCWYDAKGLYPKKGSDQIW